MKHELEQETGRDDDTPYKKVVLNKVYKEEDKTLLMESWSILVTTLDRCSMTKRTHIN